MTTFSTWTKFKAAYGQDPHLGCYILSISRAMGEPWYITLIIDNKELREVAVTMASKRELIPWCRKSQKLIRYNMKQIIGEPTCRI